MLQSFKKYLLNEAKQRGLLYHFTRGADLDSILGNNIINSGSVIKTGVSTTRDYGKTLAMGFKRLPIRIVLDGDKLSNKYKITPFNDFPKVLQKGREEKEEMIKTKNGIPNIDKYIIKITFNEKSSYYNEDEYNELKNKYHNIPFEKTNGWYK